MNKLAIYEVKYQLSGWEDLEHDLKYARTLRIIVATEVEARQAAEYDCQERYGRPAQIIKMSRTEITSGLML